MADFINVRCPSCGHQSQVPSLTAGGPVRCTQCAKVFTATAVATPRPAAAPPRVPPGAAPVGYATPQQPGPYAQYSGPTTTSKAAVASLVCGLVCVVWPITPIAAIVCGAVGLSASSKPGVKGRGMATAGLILGCLALVFGLMVSILLPSLNRAREIANRAKCASNMHQIGLAILLYQNSNNSAYPPSLTVLATNSVIGPNVFVCPSSNDTPAGSVAQIETPGHCSYTYYGRGDFNPSATDVVLSENDSDHSEGMNLLFGDGHAEYMQMAQARTLIEQAKKDLAYRDAHPGSAAIRSPFGLPR